MRAVREFLRLGLLQLRNGRLSLVQLIVLLTVLVRLGLDLE
jgi:hypothetical protein